MERKLCLNKNKIGQRREKTRVVLRMVLERADCNAGGSARWDVADTPELRSSQRPRRRRHVCKSFVKNPKLLALIFMRF